MWAIWIVLPSKWIRARSTNLYHHQPLSPCVGNPLLPPDLLQHRTHCTSQLWQNDNEGISGLQVVLAVVVVVVVRCGRETLSKVQRLTAALCHLQLAILSCSTCKYFENFPTLANILDAFQVPRFVNMFHILAWDLELDSWIGRTLDCLNRAGVWRRINPVSVFVVYQYCICPPLAPIWTHLMGCGPRYNVLRL